MIVKINAKTGDEILKDMFNFKPKKFDDLETFKKKKSKLYKTYLEKAKGDVLIIYEPGHADADPNGFLKYNIIMVTKRDNKIRFIVDDEGMEIAHLYEEPNKLYWMGGLRSLQYAYDAKEGTEFKGWKRTKQYKLTKKEIKNLTHNKIFENMGIDGA